MRLFSGFAGIGGMDEAFLRVFPEGKIVGFSELDPHYSKCKKITKHTMLNHFISRCDECGREKKQWASGIYAHKFFKSNEKIKNYGDARKIIPRRLPDFDIFTFGYPCQDNSIAGKRKGQTADTRSGLLNEAVYLMKQLKYYGLRNQGILLLKTSRDSSRLMKELTSLKHLNYLPSLIYVCHNTTYKCSFVIHAGYSPKIESGYSLLDLLEENPDRKYFLSQKAILNMKKNLFGKVKIISQER